MGIGFLNEEAIVYKSGYRCGIANHQVGGDNANSQIIDQVVFHQGDCAHCSIRVLGRIDRLAYVEAKKKKGFSLWEALKK